MELSREILEPLATVEIPLNLPTNENDTDETSDEPHDVLTSSGAKAKLTFFADGLRRLSISPAISGSLSPVPHGPYNPTEMRRYPDPPSSPLREFWIRDRPSILVALSQLFAALMNLSARLLEFDGEGMHPIQVLLLRQGLTVICCFVYTWWKGISDFPFGKKEVRWLLLARGFLGFFGIYGMWYSMMYLPLADATVITFLAPGVASLMCYFALREPFTRAEQVATVVALLGVVLIARPATLFSQPSSSDNATVEAPEQALAFSSLDGEPTAEERLLAVGVALLGVLGAAGAFTSIRAIGKRAHPLISVNFFAMACTVICVLVLSLASPLNIGQPHLRWTTPASLKTWFLLLSLGALGFIMQYLLTAGLSADKSNRANAMIYTHMLFAVSFDRWIFGHSMEMMSFAGCALILGSALTVVLMRKHPAPKVDDVERAANSTGMVEGSPMLVGVGGNADGIRIDRAL